MHDRESQDTGLLGELETFLQELESYTGYVVRWWNREQLKRAEVLDANELRKRLWWKVGRLGPLITDLTQKDKVIVQEKEHESSVDMWGAGLSWPLPKGGIAALGICIDTIRRACGRLESDIQMGIRDDQGRLYMPTAEPPKAFIAHKGETGALAKLKEFLEALGIHCVIAEREPSNGRSVEKQVTWTYEPADFAVILATKGGVIDKKTGAQYMGMNVADELGRARERYENRIILLLEKGVQSHTNISEIVHERFTPQSMDKAFIKIVKELKNWHLVRAVKP